MSGLPSPDLAQAIVARALANGGDFAELFAELVRAQAREDACIALLAARPVDVAGYGRIVRSPDGTVQAIVEEDDADEATRGVKEVNGGDLLLRRGLAARQHRRRAAIGQGRAVSDRPGGHGSPDRPPRRRGSGYRAPSWRWGSTIESAWRLAERVLRTEIAERHMRNGVYHRRPVEHLHRCKCRDRGGCADRALDHPLRGLVDRLLVVGRCR